MSVSVAEFWKLAVESQTLSAEQSRKLADAYAKAKGGPPADADVEKLAKALVSNGAISRYQAKVLLAGRAGPFVYGDYLVFDRLDSGRLAGLFRARHIASRFPVCLYFLSGPGLQDPDALARFASQAAAAQAAGARQPHLARCYHWVDLGAYKFVAIEDLHGESLAERLAEKGKLPASEACRIIRQAAMGLESLHALNQFHGQIRPANLWLAEYGRLKLLGFPLAHDPLAPAEAVLDAQADYLAPELSQPARAADARSDIYSLGCTLFQLLCGQALFAGGDRSKKAARHAAEPPPLDKLKGLAPPALVQVLAYMLNKNPEQRYQGAAALVQALAPYAPAEPKNETTPHPGASGYELWLKQLTLAPASAPAASANHAGLAAGSAAATAVLARPVGAAVAAASPTMVGPTMVAPVMASPAIATAPAFPAVQPAPTFASTNGGVSSAASRVRKSRGSSLALFACLGLAGLLVAGAVAAMMSSQETPQPKPPEVDRPITDNGGNNNTLTSPNELERHLKEQAAAAVDGPPEPIQSIGRQTIWQSPTSGEPLNLAYLAPGAQAILALRPAELVTHPEWERLSDARTLGALAGWLTADLPKAAGTGLANIESVVVGLLDGTPGPPRVALVVRTVESVSRDELLAGWGNPQAEQIERETIWVGKNAAYYLPETGQRQTLVIAPPDEMREIAQSGGQPPALRREIEALVETSDAARHGTLLFAPNFTFTGAKSLFTEQGAKLQEPLDAFLVMENSDGAPELPKAAELSFHLADDLFLEFRVYNSFVGKQTGPVAQEFRERVARLPKQVSEYVRDLALSNYSKPVLWDYKDRLELLNKYARVGIDGKQAVLRAYLPAVAAHNLSLGAHLALLENPSGGARLNDNGTVAPAKEPQTIAEKLKKKTSLAFPNNSLETSLKILGDDLEIEIEILGGDLQQDGITKNQAITNLNERDQPAVDILRTILKKANPDGKLVYVIKPKEGGGEVLQVTTRAGAEKRGDQLPPELELKK